VICTICKARQLETVPEKERGICDGCWEGLLEYCEDRYGCEDLYNDEKSREAKTI